MTDVEQAELIHLREVVKAYHRACANVAAQYERFRGADPFTYHVHPDSMRNISAAHYRFDPEAKKRIFQ